VQYWQARRAVTIHIVIDIIHVLEYPWKAAWSPNAADDPAAGRDNTRSAPDRSPHSKRAAPK
jgi:hypothetical protein